MEQSIRSSTTKEDCKRLLKNWRPGPLERAQGRGSRIFLARRHDQAFSKPRQPYGELQELQSERSSKRAIAMRAIAREQLQREQLPAAA